MAAATEAKTVHSAVVTCFNVITSHSLPSFCYLTIEATYTTISGETKTSLLLTSGWWGLSRHFHYVPEILAAFFWTVPALFNHFLSYFYVVFLTILLFDRAKRDDDSCRSKYGKYWKLYCKKVPYKNIPGIY